jgi:peptide chain release factor
VEIFNFTGIVVKVHTSRLLDKNRIFARQLLTERLDQLLNGEDSVASQKKRIEESKSNKTNAKGKKLRELKAAWKERESP